MKGNYKFLLLALLIAFASCSFTNKTFDDPDKDKLLIQLITYVLDQGHFDPQDINDDFSANVFEDYLKQLDPFKRYFYESDIKEFEAYKDLLDDQIKAYDVTFFNVTHKRLLERIAESKKIYTDILEKPFDFNISESYSSDYDKLTYVKSKKEMKTRWKHQLKFSTIANYDDALAQRDLN
jgi:carboxyl-terminal processing protease